MSSTPTAAPRLQAYHIHRGDTVVVIKGRERGKRGKVKRVLPGKGTRAGRVEIEKVQMVRKHNKPSQKNPNGGISDIEGSIALANVLLWCETCTAPRRSRKKVEASIKSRVCTKCGTGFSNPGM